MIALVGLWGIVALNASGSSSVPTPTPSAAGPAGQVRPTGSDVSRAGGRDPLPRPSGPSTTRPSAKPVDLDLRTRWLTADLNVWDGPGEDNRLLTVLAERASVQATGAFTGAWAQVRYDNDFAWVRAAYLVNERPQPAPEPEPEPTQPPSASEPTDEPPTAAEPPSAVEVSGAPCADGSAVESGLTANAVAVYRAVCASYPEVSAWGGLRPGDDGNHGTGQALDVMVGSSDLGYAIAEYVRTNAAALGVSEILWSQHIWTVERSSEGWRPFEDRGSPTANHFDHVHVSVY